MTMMRKVEIMANEHIVGKFYIHVAVHRDKFPYNKTN
jgi:hypothetical protein